MRKKKHFLTLCPLPMLSKTGTYSKLKTVHFVCCKFQCKAFENVTKIIVMYYYIYAYDIAYTVMNITEAC